MGWRIKHQHQTDFSSATWQASWGGEATSCAPWTETCSIHVTRKSLEILTFQEPLFCINILYKIYKTVINTGFFPNFFFSNFFFQDFCCVSKLTVLTVISTLFTDAGPTGKSMPEENYKKYYKEKTKNLTTDTLYLQDGQHSGAFYFRSQICP